MSRDVIDVIREQHSASFPDKDTSGVGITGRLLRLSALVEQRRNRLLDGFDLTQGDFDVLATLRRSAEPKGLNPKDLQKSTMITSGGMTKRLDRLEHAGLIERHPDPGDRRGTLITLTAEGRSRVDLVLPAVFDAETEMVQRALGDQSDVSRLESLLRDLLVGMESADTGTG